MRFHFVDLNLRVWLRPPQLINQTLIRCLKIILIRNRYKMQFDEMGVTTVQKFLKVLTPFRRVACQRMLLLALMKHQQL